MSTQVHTDDIADLSVELGKLAVDSVDENKFVSTALGSGLTGGSGVPITLDSHSGDHENGGADEIDVTDLSGLLADAQTPLAHASNHTDGTDDIQNATAAQKGLVTAAQITMLEGHAARHENGGADEISVAGLSGALADAQIPTAHAASHTDGTDDVQDATALQKGLMTLAYAGKLDGIAAGADVTGANWPQVHAVSHGDGGGDEISVAGLSGVLADNQNPVAHASDHTDGTDDIQDATAAQKGLMTLAYAGKLDGIEAGADVTDWTNVAAAAAAASSTLDLNGQTITNVGTVDGVDVSTAITAAAVITDKHHLVGTGGGRGVATSVIQEDATKIGINVAPLATLDVVGDARFGDSATNYASFAADGELNLVGTARVMKEVKLTAGSFAPGASGATATIIGNYSGWAFGINDDMLGELEVPFDWDSSTDLICKVYWYIDEAYVTNSGEVQWQITWSACPTDASEAIDAPTHTGTIDFGDQDIPATAKRLTKTGSGTIAAASLASGDLIGITVSRIALDGGANPAAEPVMVHLEVEYVANSLGEAT